MKIKFFNGRSAILLNGREHDLSTIDPTGLYSGKTNGFFYLTFEFESSWKNISTNTQKVIKLHLISLNIDSCRSVAKGWQGLKQENTKNLLHENFVSKFL